MGISPSNWKVNTESTNVATHNQAGQSHVEFILMTMPKKIFSDSNKLLLDPKIMVADTGAKCDTTPHKTGFFKLKDAT